METKDYISLLSFVVSLSSFLLAVRGARKADRAKAEAAAAKATINSVEVIARKNAIVNEYQTVLMLIAEARFYTTQLYAMVAGMKAGDDPDGHATAKRLIQENLKYLNHAAKTVDESMHKVRDFDANDIATNPEARKMLEELHGRPQQMKIKVSDMIAQLKRDLEKLSGLDASLLA